jgi:hypothetical protein
MYCPFTTSAPAGTTICPVGAAYATGPFTATDTATTVKAAADATQRPVVLPINVSSPPFGNGRQPAEPTPFPKVLVALSARNSLIYHAFQPSPKCRSPPIENSAIIWPRRFLNQCFLEAINGQVNRPESVVYGLIIARATSKFRSVNLLRAYRTEVQLSLNEEDLIRAALIFGPAQLEEIAFPSTDWAY